MVSGKNVPFSKAVRVFSMANLLLCPLVIVSRGMSWFFGMSMSWFVMRYIKVTFCFCFEMLFLFSMSQITIQEIYALYSKQNNHNCNTIYKVHE